LETGAGHTDLRFTQRGLSRDGCTYVIKETQWILEAANALEPSILTRLTMDDAADLWARTGFISPNIVVDLKCDITEFFPSCDRQLLLDMLDGVASRDYEHTDSQT
jgi:hypothetical protein